MITMHPPAIGHGVRYDVFTFKNGRCAKADEDGIIKCVTDAEAAELESCGWSRGFEKVVDTTDLRKAALAAEILHHQR